jgi:hypothetical protein
MATATIQVAYEAETSSLKATVEEINKINDKVVEGANDTAKKVKQQYTSIAQTFAAAFSGKTVEQVLKGQTTAIESLGKSGKSLTGQLRGLKQELAALETAGQDGTKAFNDLLIAAAKLEDQIGDTRDRVRILASDTFKFDAAVGATQALASGFELAQGAAALFGSESEDLQRALLKVQAATAVANGVQQIAALVTQESAVKTAVLTAAQAAYAAVVGTSTGALRLFKLAIAGTGIGLLVLAVSELVGYFMQLQSESEKTQTVFERFKSTFANAKTAIEGYRDAIIDAQSRIDVALGRTSKTEADVNKTRREGYKQVEKDLRDLVIAQELLRIEYKRELDIVNSPAFKVSSDDRIQALLKSQKLGKELAIVEAQVNAARAEGQKAIETNVKAIIEEGKATEKTKQIKRAAIVQIDNLETIAFKGSVSRKEEELQLSDKVYQTEQQRQEDILSSRLAQLELEKSINGESLQNTIDTIKTKAELEKNALGFKSIDSTKRQKINADTEKAITQSTKDETNKRIDLAVQYANAVVNAFNAINELSKVNSENRIAEITATSEAELNAINASSDLERDKARQRLALEKRTQQGIANEKTKQARRDKALALFNISVDTASSIIKTGAQLGYPEAIPFQIIAGIIGGIQLAAVAAKPLPKFERGGLIGGKLHSQGGTLIEAEKGEYMVNRRQSAKHRRELDAMNTSTEAFRRMIDEKYVRPALMSYSAGRRSKEGVVVNASLNSKSMEKKLDTINKSLKNRNVVVNINQQDTRYSWR